MSCSQVRYATALHYGGNHDAEGGEGGAGSGEGGGGGVGGGSVEFTFSSPSAAFLHAAMISSYEASFCSLTVRSTTLTSTVGTCNSQGYESSLNCRG